MRKKEPSSQQFNNLMVVSPSSGLASILTRKWLEHPSPLTRSIKWFDSFFVKRFAEEICFQHS